MLKLLKYIMLGKERIVSRKVVYADPTTVQILYTTSWGREIIGTVKYILGCMHRGVSIQDGSKILKEIIHDMDQETMIKCIMDAEAYIIEQIKALKRFQVKLFRLNMFYQGAFSEAAQNLIREVVKVDRDIQDMAVQLEEYKKLIEA